MRTIGLVGGLSWYSSMEYYRVINELVQERRGGHASAEVALQSLDFSVVRACQERDDWPEAGRLVADAATRCQSAGADLVLICSNLMHKVFADVEAAVDVPVLHIADAVAREAKRHRWSRLGLLGTKWVMQEPFYAERLATHGIEVVTPGAEERVRVDHVIFEELTQGRVETSSRQEYLDIIATLSDDGADAVILACTEIELLVSARDTSVRLLDSMRVHATRAVDLALAEA
ncbi:MAG TPA: aspartate/glutamate racemase family protein [Nocardioidaceae bacterium]|nr:aspartate/glutamate racemase family protein [Nocardioidaceae bacterium]